MTKDETIIALESYRKENEMMDEEVIDILRGKVAELEAENTLHKSAMDNLAAKLTEAERQRDELMACLNLIYSWANKLMNDPDWINTDYPRIQAAIAKVKGQS